MDIYDNIDILDEVHSVTEIYNENKDLKIKVERYSAEIEKLQRDYNQLHINHENLLRNYTSMLLTAKAEIARKTETIRMINIEKDQMFLRMISDRNNGRGRRNNKNNKKENEPNDPSNSQENVHCNPINKVLKENRFQACQFSSDEDDTVSKSLNRDNQEHKEAQPNRDLRDARHKIRERYTERVNDRDRQRERDRERDYERERFKRHNQDRHRLSPEHHQRGRAPHRDFPENKYSRNRSRHRILRSPGPYDRSKSRDRRHLVDYPNEKEDHHSLKHKIEDAKDEACPKRRRVGSNEVHRQVTKCIEEVPTCQSPDDYNTMEEIPNEPHVVKEIKAASSSQLEDPRYKHPKYVQDSDQQDKVSLIAVSGQNIEIKQIPGYDLEENKESSKISSITENPNVYCHSESSNMSVESGEIVENIQQPDSSQTSNVSNKLNYSQPPETCTQDFDTKSYKITKRKSTENISSAQISHGPSPVELLYKEFETSLGQSRKSDKPSRKKTKSENLEENDWKDIKDEIASSKSKDCISKNKAKSIVEGDLELSDDNSDHGFEEGNKNKKHKTSLRTETSDSHHKEKKNENKCENSTKLEGECSKDAKVKHKIKSDHKVKDAHAKDSKRKKSDSENKPRNTDKDVKNTHRSKDKSNRDSKDKLTNRSNSEAKSSVHDKADHELKTVSEEVKNVHQSKDKSKKDKSNDNTLINKDQPDTKNILDDKSDHHVKTVSETEVTNEHKRKDKSKKEKSTESVTNKDQPETKNTPDDNADHQIKAVTEKEVKNGHKRKNKINKDKSTDSMTTKNQPETKNILDHNADHQIKTITEKEVKNCQNKRDKSKEHVKDKNTKEIKSKNENKHTNKIKSNSNTKNIPEKDTKDIENGRREKNNSHKHKSKHGDTAIDNATKITNDPIDQNPSEEKIREILQESCKKHSIVEKDDTTPKTSNIMEKMTDLFGDNSLITPEDLNIESQTSCDIYSEYIPSASPSDTQDPDDDLWNVASRAQTEDKQGNDKTLEVIKLRKVVKETKSNVSEAIKDINDVPGLSKDCTSISGNSMKDNSQQSIGSSNYKIFAKEHEKSSENHHKYSKDVTVTDSQKNTLSKYHIETSVENNITNETTVSVPVDLSNIINPQTACLDEVIRLEPETSQSEPDVVKTVIISSGIQHLSSLENNENCSSLPMLSTVNNRKDSVTNISTPEIDVSDITSAVNSITNISGNSSEENTPVNHHSQNGQDTDKPDIRIRIVRKGRRSLKK